MIWLTTASSYVSTVNGGRRWWRGAVSVSRGRCPRPASTGLACVSQPSTATSNSSRNATEMTVTSAPADLQGGCRQRIIDAPPSDVSAPIRSSPVSVLSCRRFSRQMYDVGRSGDSCESFFVISSVPRRSTVVKLGVWKIDTVVEESVVVWRQHSCPGRRRSADGRLAVNAGDILVPAASRWRRRRQAAVRRQLVQLRFGPQTNRRQEIDVNGNRISPSCNYNTRSCRVEVRLV